MERLKDEAMNIISKLPDSANIDDIMYRLYVIDKVRKGKEAIKQGDMVPSDQLRGEIEKWKNGQALQKRDEETFRVRTLSFSIKRTEPWIKPRSKKP